MPRGGRVAGSLPLVGPSDPRVATRAGDRRAPRADGRTAELHALAGNDPGLEDTRRYARRPAFVKGSLGSRPQMASGRPAGSPGRRAGGSQRRRVGMIARTAFIPSIVSPRATPNPPATARNPTTLSISRCSCMRGTPRRRARSDPGHGGSPARPRPWVGRGSRRSSRGSCGSPDTRRVFSATPGDPQTLVRGRRGQRPAETPPGFSKLGRPGRARQFVDHLSRRLGWHPGEARRRQAPLG